MVSRFGKCQSILDLRFWSRRFLPLRRSGCAEPREPIVKKAIARILAMPRPLRAFLRYSGRGWGNNLRAWST
jgi:hypothetical protein